MSYGEELMVEMLIQEEIWRQDYENHINQLWGAVKAKVWVTADNTSISIPRMGDRHIRNCIAMLERKLPDYEDELADIARSYISLFNSELQIRYPPQDATEGFSDEEEDEFIAESLL